MNYELAAVLGVFTKHKSDGKQKMKYSLCCALAENTKHGEIASTTFHF